MSEPETSTSLAQPTNVSTPITTGILPNDQLLTYFDIFLNCFLIHVLSLLGIIANIFNLLILSRHSFNETTNILLLSMSAVDLVCSVLQPFRRVECIIERFNPLIASTIRSISVVYLFNLPDIFVALSILHTTAISVERVVAVCFPLRVSRIFTPRRVKLMILTLYIYTVTMMSPTLTLLDYVWIYDPKYNASRGDFVYAKFYADHYNTLNQYSSAGLTNLFITSTLLTILACSLVICVQLMIGRRKDFAKMSTKQIKVVKMLLIVCVVNSGASLPTVVIHTFLLYSNMSILSGGKARYLLRSVMCCLHQCNVSINFFIYVTMSSKFANTYQRLVCCKT